MFTNTIYLPKDKDFSEKVSESTEFYFDKETKNTNRYTCLSSDNIDKSRGFKVTLTIEPLTASKKTVKKRTKKTKK